MIITGERTFSTTAEPLGERAVNWVVVKAKQGNSNKVYVGPPGVTVPSGDDDLTTGFELSAQEETPVLYVSNLNQVHVIDSAAGPDGVTFIAQI